MPDNAPVEEDHEVQIDFRAYSPERPGVWTVHLGSPSSTVLISATDSDGQLQVSVASDVSEDPEQAVTATIEYLEQIVELLRMDGRTEEAWAQQFVPGSAAPEEPALRGDLEGSVPTSELLDTPISREDAER